MLIHILIRIRIVWLNCERMHGRARTLLLMIRCSYRKQLKMRIPFESGFSSLHCFVLSLFCVPFSIFMCNHQRTNAQFEPSKTYLCRFVLDKSIFHTFISDVLCFVRWFYMKIDWARSMFGKISLRLEMHSIQSELNWIESVYCVFCFIFCSA